MQTESVIDCSGKILISGGYLILDENLSGLVICPTDATGRCTIKKVQNGRCRLEIYSENFRGTAIYEIDWSAPQAKQVSEGTTEFVDFAIKTVVQYLFESKVPTESFSSLNMNVYINPVFYGHQESSFKTLIKTGLGSSAVVTTLITRALLSSWLPESFVSDRLVFFLSYIAHSEAQGKLGSGFDIAASVFGSIIFKKFSVPADGRLFDRCQSFLSDSVLNFTPIKLKAGLVQGILVGNRCGSSTVSLVSTFLAWKKTHPAECRAFFNEIDIWTNRIAKAIAFEGTGSQSDASDEDLEAARVASRVCADAFLTG